MSKAFEFSAALFGAVCPGPVAIGDVAVRSTSWEEWHFLEKSDVANEQAGRWVWAGMTGEQVAVQPPPRLVVTSEDPTDWHTEDHSSTQKHRLAVLSLRVAGVHTFVDPFMTMRTATSGLFVQRQLGPYRMLGYSYLAKPSDRIDAAVAAEATALAELIVVRDASLLLRPVLGLSAPSLTPNAKVLIALQLIEGVFGRSTDKIRGLGFAERLLASGLSADRVTWILDGSQGGGRALRNDVAHGRPISLADAEKLADFARTAMRRVLEFPTIGDEGTLVERFRQAAWS
jgi:uncharacterized protein YndB with AHSA1/START domain